MLFSILGLLNPWHSLSLKWSFKVALKISSRARRWISTSVYSLLRHSHIMPFMFSLDFVSWGRWGWLRYVSMKEWILMTHYVRLNESCEFTRCLESQQLLYYAFPWPKLGCFPRSSYISKKKDLVWVCVHVCVCKLQLVQMKHVWATFKSSFNWMMSLDLIGNQIRGWKKPQSLLLSKLASRQSFLQERSLLRSLLSNMFLAEGSQSKGKWMEVWLTTGHNGYISFFCKWKIVFAYS